MEVSMSLEALKREYINAIYETKALLVSETPLTLASGGKSHVYLNHRNFLPFHQHLDLIARIYMKLLEPHVQEYRLGVVDSTMSPILAGAMSALGKRDVVIIKIKKTEHGTKEETFGDISGEVVLIDDMTSTGGTLLDAAPPLRKRGGVVRFAVVSACRDETAAVNLAGEGIQLLSIATFKEIITTLRPRLNPREMEWVSKEFPELGSGTG
jgi:orotate phosphoribosyltransferase